MKRKYMSYLWEPAPIPRSTQYRMRQAQRKQSLAVVQERDEEHNQTNHQQANTTVQAPNVPTLDVTAEQNQAAMGPTPHFPSVNESEPQPSVADETMHFGDENEIFNTGTIEAASSENFEERLSMDCDFLPEPESSGEDKIGTDQEEGPLFDETLCLCSSATAGDAYLMTLALGLRHGLSWTAQVDILTMINTLYGRKVVDNTKYMYWKYVKTDKIPTETHYYCPSCLVRIEKLDIIDGQYKCICDETVPVSTAPYFITLDLKTQILSLLNEPNISSSLINHRFQRKKISENALEDIYDGSEYQKHCKEGGILSNPFNFSYCFNTDGIQTGVSSSVNRTCWPIFISLNELPFAERKNNVLLAGIYVGRSHPKMNTFLEPFVEQANKLSTEGVEWTHVNEKVTSKIVPLCAVVDSPARCSMLQMNQFNSLYGCTFCYQKTVHTRAGRRFGNSIVGTLRTHESTINDMLMAHEMQRTVRNKKKRRHRGVWFPSVLMNLKYFDLCKGFVPDYLHALLLGAVKQHMEILLTQRKTEFWKNMEDEIGIEHLISLIDSYILEITPPSCITRLPRGLAHRELWKASEWRSWLLFYAYVCMKGELNEKYLKHFCMLSVAANILLQKSISHSELDFAETLLAKYCFYYEEYFGTESMNYCIHLMLHLVQGVRSMGGLWTHNTFLYEGQNRFILQMMSSPNRLSVQLANKYMAYFSLNQLCKTLATNDRTVDFCVSLTEKQLKFFYRSNGVTLVGSGDSYEPTGEVMECLIAHNKFSPQCKSYNRCIVNQSRLSTATFSIGKQQNNSVVETVDGRVYTLVYFLLCNDSPVILAREITLNHYPLLSNEHFQLCHIFERNEDGPLVIIEPRDILSMCLVMNNTLGNFIGKIPFGCLGD